VDRNTLNLAAAVLCGIGSFASLLTALFGRGGRDRAAVLSSLFGTIGSAVWAAAAYQDVTEERAGRPEIAVG
jgi:hypothetical protein